MNTYETYLNHPAGNILTMEEALEIYTDLLHCVQKCRLEDKAEFWNDFLIRAAEYTMIRCEWETLSREEKMDRDQGRTLAHTGVITALNILARIAQKEDIDASWRERLGDDRKRIGDFACFVTYITGISNR